MLKVRVVAITWLLVLLTDIFFIRDACPDDSQITVGLLVGGVITLMFGEGARLWIDRRNGKD